MMSRELSYQQLKTANDVRVSVGKFFMLCLYFTSTCFIALFIDEI